MPCKSQAASASVYVVSETHAHAGSVQPHRGGEGDRPQPPPTPARPLLCAMAPGPPPAGFIGFLHCLTVGPPQLMIGTQTYATSARIKRWTHSQIERDTWRTCQALPHRPPAPPGRLPSYPPLPRRSRRRRLCVISAP